MNIIAVDTSTQFLCAGVSVNGALKASYRKQAFGELSKSILPTIAGLLSGSGILLSDVGAFALGAGPGSFTGLRIGFATVKGLNFPLKRPVVAIPSLDIIAHNAALRDTGYICPVVDAKRGLLYACFYKKTPHGLRRVSPYMLSTPQGLCSRIKDTTCFLGDGATIMRGQISVRLLKKVRFESEEAWYPKPAVLVALAQAAVASRKHSKKSSAVFPMYLYKRDCQVRTPR
jgi:tRNA threonylcarbamoyladenosine biosynthesis protein TsaB